MKTTGTLDMGSLVEAELRRSGVETKMSRTKDVTFPTASKIPDANAWGSAVVIDLHYNAGGGTGFEVYRSQKADGSEKLAQAINNAIVATGRKSRGVKTNVQNGVDYFGMKNKEYMIEKKVKPFFEKLKLNDITAAHVRKWQNTLLDDPADYSPTYLKTLHNQLSAIFNYAVKYYGLPENPARRAGSIGKKKADTMQFWTLDEFNQFLPAVSDKPDSKLLFLILYYTGMRIGEALALTPNDIDFKAQTVRVDETYQRIDREDVLDDPKTEKSNRVITIPPFLCDEIEAYMGMLYECGDEDRLFEFTQSFAGKEMERGCAASGVKKIRVHDLRHSHASLLIDMGFHIKLIAERLGHENIETTLETYGHLYPNKHGEVADRLEEFGKRYQNVTTEEKKAPETA